MQRERLGRQRAHGEAVFGAALEESKEQAPRQMEFSESSINRKPDKGHLQTVDMNVKIDSSSTGKTKTSLKNRISSKETTAGGGKEISKLPQKLYHYHQ